MHLPKHMVLIFNIYSFQNMQHIPQQSKALGKYFNKDILRKVLQKEQLRWKHSPLLCFCVFLQVQNSYFIHYIPSVLSSTVIFLRQHSHLSSDPFSPSTLFNGILILSMKHTSISKKKSPNFIFISFLPSHFQHCNLKSPYKYNPLIGLKMRILYSSLITMRSLNYPRFVFSYSMSISSANLVDSALEILPIFISNLLLSPTTDAGTKGNVV